MYVDETYYNDVFKGEPVESAGFSVLCQRAGEIVEELTLYRLTEEVFPMRMRCAHRLNIWTRTAGQRWIWEMECQERHLASFLIRGLLRELDPRNSLYFHRGRKESCGRLV